MQLIIHQISRPDIDHWLYVHTLEIASADTSCFYYPDPLIQQPFSETAFTLSESDPLAAELVEAFEQHAPHTLCLFLTSTKHPEDQAIFESWQKKLSSFEPQPDFFTPEEDALYQRLQTLLHLTQSQSVQLKKASISCRLRNPKIFKTILTETLDYTGKTKKERNDYFYALIDRLFH